MRTTITLPQQLFDYLDKSREKSCHTRSAYIALLLKRAKEAAGVTQKRTPAKSK